MTTVPSATPAPHDEPNGELALRMIAMPADTNPAGDIFGGWIMSMLDLAGAASAVQVAQGRVATVAVTELVFLRPVKVGDAVCCYTTVQKIGRTSLTLRIEAWVLRQRFGDRLKVTSADFTFVALDEDGKPRPVLRSPPP